MGVLDVVLSNVVQRLTGVFSSTPAVVSREVQTFDPSTDTTTSSPPLTAEVITSPPSGFHASLVNGDSIQVGDRQLISRPDWGALGSPKLGDKIVRGELSGTVVKITPLNSGDAVVAYELQIRTP